MAKPGDIVKVKVLEVDAPRKRIALTMRLDDTPDQRQAPGGRERNSGAQAPQTPTRAAEGRRRARRSPARRDAHAAQEHERVRTRRGEPHPAESDRVAALRAVKRLAANSMPSS